MAKDSLIDYPNYNPEEKVVFPPTGPATDERDVKNREARQGPDYSQSYDPDPRAANPVDTDPAAPDVRQPFVDVENEAALEALSPAPDWKADPRDDIAGLEK